VEMELEVDLRGRRTPCRIRSLILEVRGLVVEGYSDLTEEDGEDSRRKLDDESVDVHSFSRWIW